MPNTAAVCCLQLNRGSYCFNVGKTVQSLNSDPDTHSASDSSHSETFLASADNLFSVAFVSPLPAAAGLLRVLSYPPTLKSG